VNKKEKIQEVKNPPHSIGFQANRMTLFTLAALTILAIGISIYCLSSGYFIIFQNLFYIPIIIACVYYTRRGFVFSCIIACIYFVLTIAFTRDSVTILQALVRVLIFILVAAVITYLSLTRKKVEETLQQQHDHLEDLVLERTTQLEEDITERKRVEVELAKYRDHLEKLVGERTQELATANERLQELDRLKSLFIASMSHELRTPLNSIIGFTGILLQGLAGPLNEEQQKQLGMVNSSSKHLLALINDVIDVSKIESEKIDLIIEDFDLSRLITEVKSSFEVAISDKGLLLHIDKPDKCTIRSDERRVKQVIMNLVSNAVKYTDKGATKIKLVQADGKVKIIVTDSGIGIRAKDMPKLFEQFSRIILEGQDIREGTGLGLYLSQKLAGILGGEIRAESQFGKGSDFTLTLPMEYKGV